jgi:hypothetical protein
MGILLLAPFVFKTFKTIPSALLPIPLTSAMSVSRNRVAHRPLGRDVRFGRKSDLRLASKTVLKVLELSAKI